MMRTAVEDVVEERFSVGAQPELAISGIAGRISITVADEPVITMRATKTGSARAKENTRIEYSQTGSRVSIQTKSEPGGLLSITRGTCAVLYDIAVPRDCEVRARAVSADVVVNDVRAPTTAQTVSGDVSIGDVAGDVSVTTVSGDVTGREIVGTLSLRTTSGDAQFSACTLRHFNLNTVSGDFSIETPLTPSAQYLAKTVSGDFHVLVPPGTGATVQMKSISGDVSSELPADIIKSGRRHWQGRINGGGATLEMSSVSGDLRIGRSPSAPAVLEDAPRDEIPRPAPPVEIAPAAPEMTEGGSTADILKALERGEISVEEAMSRLDALRELS